MTYRNWMEENKPEKVHEAWAGGVMGCPSDYQLEPRSELPCEGDEHATCEECWNREMWRPKNTDRRVADAPRNDKPKDDSVRDDPVSHPSHYTAGGVECIDAIAAALCKYTDGVDAWLAGQVIKYLWRSPLKGAYEQDLKKAQFYMNRLVKRQEEKP